jgi:hypothetical protein
MTAGALDDLVERMVASLERERQLLVAGDYQTLADEAAGRQAMMERLHAAPREAAAPLADRIADLRAAIARNERLLRAALDGAAAGRRRVAEILQARERLSTYNAAGAVVEHRAGAATGRKA